jgi:nitroreductase
VRLIAGFLLAWTAAAADLRLPPARMDGGRPLMQALKLRQTIRDFKNAPLAPQVLSDLLWAAFGINRPDGKRTAPSAWDQQEMDLYVFSADGIYLYDAKPHQLRGIMTGDRREWAGKDFAQAPITIVFVADFARAGKSEPKDRLRYSALHTGFISQNVYLFCASEGLGTVVHDAADRPQLAKRLNLRADQQVILSQAVGWPK